MKKYFTERIEEFQKKVQKYGSLSTRYTIARIVLFIAFLAAWIFLLNENHFSEFFLSLLAFPFVFGFVVNKHRGVNQKQQFYRHLVLINEEEVNRLDYKPKNFYNGAKWMDEEHPYSGDLDLYGPKSLYHFLNRTSTSSGEEKLAQWLMAPAPIKEILERQECVEELKEQVDWRQEIQATELEIQQQDSLSSFFSWLNKPDVAVSPFLIYIFPLLNIAAITLWIVGIVSFYIPAVFILITAGIIGKYISKTTELGEVTSKGLATFKKYRHIISLIENKKFESKKLQHIQHRFNDGGYKASGALKRLEKILEFLDARSNMFYHILNLVFLIDLHLIYQSNKWRARNTEYVSHWFEAIGEIEALSSFAGFLFANDTLSMPVIIDDNYIYNGKGLGHPLIHSSERVSNDYHVEGKGTVHIITGSNMSGKSTFLRTVAINAVLAYAGAPVCAKSLTISIMKVFTSMRTHDDLEAHVSSFYAELKRIRKLLKLLETDNAPYLFALDEILKGTNSHDRNAGAAALIRQLHKQNCMGMVSTHDLELGDMAKETGDIHNFSFNSDIVDDKIIFDYKIYDGICKSFNASKLMEQMGIKMNEQL